MNVEITGTDLLLPVSVSLVAICSFAWALRGHFVTVGRIPQGMRLLSAISLLAYIMYVGLLFRRGYEATTVTIPGLIGFTVSIVLFWWTVAETRSHRLRLAYSDADPDRINTGGPYAVVRHPFYLSYIVFWISTALVAGSWQWVIALILTLWYVRIARGEERRFRSSGLSPAYDQYRQRTGMLLPRLRLQPRAFGRSDQGPNDLPAQTHSPRPPPRLLPSQSSK
jgi:protein-S-isoprenylcysteine O-methyltransferase Ste14